VVAETGTPQALPLRLRAKLLAPELPVAECANILWQKVQRRGLLRDEALLAARLPRGADIELLPTQALLEAAADLAVELDHPAYDCRYLAPAVASDCSFVSTDERFPRRLGQARRTALREMAISLSAAAAL